MKRIAYYLKNLKTFYLLLISIAVMGLQSCNPDDKKEDVKDNAIEVVTNLMEFQIVDEIPSGWNTFRYVNKSKEPHFFLLDKYPAGKTIEDGRKEVIPVFQNGMDLINEGKPEEANAEFGKLPPWFADIVYTGGSGLISPGHTSVTTLNLEPGYYVMECYVKMETGVFHAAMGMTKAFTVIDSSSGNTEPTATVNITIAGNEGIVYTDAITKGETTFSVYFKDQAPHENFVGHDVNLVKLDENHDLGELEKWMNWTDAKGLITPPPQGVTFLGGVNEMPAGSTGYFTVNLEPGNYAFISEVPNSLQKGMLKTFEVVD